MVHVRNEHAGARGARVLNRPRWGADPSGERFNAAARLRPSFTGRLVHLEVGAAGLGVVADLRDPAKQAQAVCVVVNANRVAPVEAALAERAGGGAVAQGVGGWRGMLRLRRGLSCGWLWLSCGWLRRGLCRGWLWLSCGWLRRGLCRGWARRVLGCKELRLGLCFAVSLAEACALSKTIGTSAFLFFVRAERLGVAVRTRASSLLVSAEIFGGALAAGVLAACVAAYTATLTRSTFALRLTVFAESTRIAVLTHDPSLVVLAEVLGFALAAVVRGASVGAPVFALNTRGHLAPVGTLGLLWFWLNGVHGSRGA